MSKFLFAIILMSQSFCFAQSFYWGAERTQEMTNKYCYFSYEMPKMIIESDNNFFPNPNLEQLWNDQKNATLNTYHEFLKDPKMCQDKKTVMKFDFRSSITTPPSSTTLVSILYKNWVEYKEPTFGYSSQVFDPIEGEMYTLADLLIDTPENVTLLQKMIKDKLKEQVPSSKISNFSKWKNSISSLSQINDFYVTGTSVILFFNINNIGTPPFDKIGVYEAEFYLDELMNAKLISSNSVLIPLLKMNHLID